MHVHTSGGLTVNTLVEVLLHVHTGIGPTVHTGRGPTVHIGSGPTVHTAW